MRISDWSSDVCSSDLDCRRTVARINFYGVERCLFHRSQTGVGLMLRISDLAVDLLIALSKFRVDAKRGILIHLGDCAFEAGRINANLSRQFTKGRCLSDIASLAQLLQSPATGKIGRASCRERVCQYV